MWDGIVIGGGLAGLIAGIRASEKRKRILIISEGVGSLTYSSGVMDFGDVGRLARQGKHPYSLLGQTVVKTGAEYFRALLPDYDGKWGESQKVLTPLGTLRRAGMVPKGLNTEALQDAERIVLMAPEGMKDFFPEVIKGNLEKAYPQGSVEVHPFRLKRFEPWYTAGKLVTGMDYARYWQSDSGIADIKDLLQQTIERQRINAGDKAVLVFPGLVSEFSALLKNTLALNPFPVIGMTAFPPSPSGQILYENLKRRLRKLGGELLVGASVKQVKLQGKQCEKVIVESKGKFTEFSARSFVLATGGIFGGGIEVTPKIKQEVIFKLPLYVPSEWTRSEFLGEQPYAGMGIEVNHELCPIKPQGQEVILENVRVVGRMLAHWDPWVEHCGGGVSLSSGWFAGEKI